MTGAKGCYYTSRAVHFFLRGRILYLDYYFGELFSSLQMGGVELVFKIYLLLCARDEQDKFIFACRLKMVMLRFLHQLRWVSFCRLDAWTDQSVWRLTQRHCAVW